MTKCPYCDFTGTESAIDDHIVRWRSKKLWVPPPPIKDKQ